MYLNIQFMSHQDCCLHKMSDMTTIHKNVQTGSDQCTAVQYDSPVTYHLSRQLQHSCLSACLGDGIHLNTNFKIMLEVEKSKPFHH